MADKIILCNEKDKEYLSNYCVFMNIDGTCDKLNHTVCQEEGCSFMILPQDEKRKREQWAKRISALDDEKQSKISKKYYGGGRPWQVNK